MAVSRLFPRQRFARVRCTSSPARHSAFLANPLSSAGFPSTVFQHLLAGCSVAVLLPPLSCGVQPIAAQSISSRHWLFNTLLIGTLFASWWPDRLYEHRRIVFRLRTLLPIIMWRVVLSTPCPCSGMINGTGNGNPLPQLFDRL